jgi:hypothetical protein
MKIQDDAIGSRRSIGVSLVEPIGVHGVRFVNEHLLLDSALS